MRLAAAALAVCLLSTACSRPSGKADVLLFDGRGASSEDVSNFRELLTRGGIDFDTAGSLRINATSAPDLQRYRLLIVPGGNFETMGKWLTSTAAGNIRAAVRNGLNYLGVCAGAFLAGNSPYNGLNLTSGIRFGFYGIENQGIRKAAVPVTSAGAVTLDQYWEDGPELTGWGEVVSKYPDGTPAITQGRYGDGWVVLTGIHPEANAKWRSGLTFRTPLEDDQQYALTLIRAALNRTSLPHY